MERPPFERVGIIGLGLIGGSIALAAKRRWPSIDITACDPAPISTEAVIQGLVAGLVASPSDLAACDLIVIATPVQFVPALIAQLAEAGVSALVTDVGSTKRTVMDATSGAPRLEFVGGHPVAGSQGWGLRAARADLFDGRAWLLVSSSHEENERNATLASFVVGLGARPEWTDAVTHDRVMAHVSQAPHVVATALRGAVESPDGSVAPDEAPGFSSEVWEGILDTNADFISDALHAIAAKLPTSAEVLTGTPAVQDLFERARALKAGR